MQLLCCPWQCFDRCFDKSCRLCHQTKTPFGWGYWSSRQNSSYFQSVPFCCASCATWPLIPRFWWLALPHGWTQWFSMPAWKHFVPLDRTPQHSFRRCLRCKESFAFDWTRSWPNCSQTLFHTRWESLPWGELTISLCYRSFQSIASHAQLVITRISKDFYLLFKERIWHCFPQTSFSCARCPAASFEL